jgi:hypothetical protein
MPWSRKIGIAVVMIIPSFVGAGLIWEFYPSWWLVYSWLAAMVVLLGVILWRTG